jgi:hypothetical protein
MLAVEDVRAVLDLGLRDYLLFLHVKHEAVTVVVVADVVLVEPGHGRDFILGANVLAIPVDDHVLAVGIECGPEDEDDVVEDGVDLGIVLGGDQLVGERDGVLTARYLRGVKAAIDVDDDLGLAGEGER